MIETLALAGLLCLGMASLAVAAGGGGSAGGSGAQNNPSTGLPPGDPGPAGSPNNPRGANTRAEPAAHADKPQAPEQAR